MASQRSNNKHRTGWDHYSQKQSSEDGSSSNNPVQNQTFPAQIKNYSLHSQDYPVVNVGMVHENAIDYPLEERFPTNFDSGQDPYIQNQSYERSSNQTFPNHNYSVLSKKYPVQNKTYPVHAQDNPADPIVSIVQENEADTDEFPWGDQFPTNLDSARKLFDHFEEVFLSKSLFLTADVPGRHVIERSVEKVFGFDTWNNRPARHQEKPSSRNRKRSIEPETLESDLRRAPTLQDESQKGLSRRLSTLAPTASTSTSGLCDTNMSTVQRLKVAATRLEQSKPIEQIPSFDLILKPGNYLLATLDLLTFRDESTGQSHICQIGSTLALAEGETFGRWNFIEELGTDKSPFGYVDQNCFYFCEGKKLVIRNASKNIKKSIEVWLEFLEKGCQKTRPSFEGIVLLAHSKEVLKQLMVPILSDKALKNRFNRVVKGVGDLNSYLMSEHHEVYGTEEKYLKLDSVAFKTIRRNCNINCDFNSKIIYDMLTTLTQGPPSYSNFFAKNINSVNSKAFHDLCKVDTRTTEEKLQSFSPLKRYIAFNLIKDEHRLVIMGMGEFKNDKRLLSKSQIMADVIVRSLLATNFNMQDMLDLFVKDGIDGIDQQLRDSFLTKMLMFQSPAVIDQITSCTKLILSFFERFGYRTLEDLTAEFESFILPPRGIPLQQWADYEPIVRYWRVTNSTMKLDGFEHDVWVYIHLLFHAGLDHSKIVFIWRQGKEYFSKMMDHIVTVYTNEVTAEPYILKLNDFPRMLAEYLAHTATSLESSVTEFPFCTWKKYRLLADAFVNYFSKQILSFQVCEEEAIVLINALLKEGITHNSLVGKFSKNNVSGPLYIRSLLDTMSYSKPAQLRLISNSMIFMFLKNIYMQGATKNIGGKHFDPEDGTSVGGRRPWNWRPTIQVDELTSSIKGLQEMLPTQEDKRWESYIFCCNSLIAMLKCISLKLRPTILVCGGIVSKDLPHLSEFIQKMLANSGLNFVTLKNLQQTGGLVREIKRCFENHREVMFPGITAGNIAKLIKDYFVHIENQKNGPAD